MNDLFTKTVDFTNYNADETSMLMNNNNNNRNNNNNYHNSNDKIMVITEGKNGKRKIVEFISFKKRMTSDKM